LTYHTGNAIFFWSVFYSLTIYYSQLNKKTMRVTVTDTFVPGEHGLQGDQIHLFFRPCCQSCYPTISAVHRAFRCLRVSVTNCYGVQCTVLRSVDKPVLIRQPNGDFCHVIDYEELLPHAPESPLTIAITLESPDHCSLHLSLSPLFPVGVDSMVAQYCGSSLHTEGMLTFCALSTATAAM
jgi:hypothetical protein